MGKFLDKVQKYGVQRMKMSDPAKILNALHNRKDMSLVKIARRFRVSTALIWLWCEALTVSVWNREPKIVRHAKKVGSPGLREYFGARFGWTLNQMAEELSVYSTTVQEFHRAYLEQVEEEHEKKSGKKVSRRSGR